MNDQARRLERNPDNKMIAGVASGVADFFGIDPTIVRIIWALSILLGGLGVIVYIVLWIVVPEAGTDRTVAHDLRDKATEAPAPTDTSPTPAAATTDTDGVDDTAQTGTTTQPASDSSGDGKTADETND